MRKMKNNKIRYKSMKRSSPMVQYKRFLLGKHYTYGFRKSVTGIPIPKVLQERIAEQWNEYQRRWSHLYGTKIERVQHEENI